MSIDKIRARFAGTTFEATPMPDAIRAVPENRITDVDVREDLRAGIEPFGRIMAAQADIAVGDVLRLYATFEPIPLYTALGRSGFTHWTERVADDDWRVWFYRGDIAAHPQESVSRAEAPDVDHGEVTLLDVRGLQPPEPMQLTLEMLAQLGPNGSLVQVNNRVPQFLIPHLEDRGYEYVLISEAPNEVRGLIRPLHQQENNMNTPETARELDVRIIPPREKHPAIFQTFESIAPGSSFILINDHDPFPLRFQFEAERTNQFTWEYVEQGPVVWRVRIGKVVP